MEMTVDTHEIDAMAAKYAHAAPIVREEVAKGLTALTIMGQNEARQNVSVDRGITRASIAHEVVPSGGSIVGRFGTNVQWGKALEFGTGVYAQSPETAAYPLPTSADLDGWGPRHGFASDAQAAAIIRWKGGTKAHPYLRPALAAIRPKVAGVMDNVLRRIVARIGGAQ